MFEFIMVSKIIHLIYKNIFVAFPITISLT